MCELLQESPHNDQKPNRSRQRQWLARVLAAKDSHLLHYSQHIPHSDKGAGKPRAGLIPSR